MADVDDAIAAMVRGGARATNILNEDLLGTAQRIAPEDEGTLAGSGHIVFVVNEAEYVDFHVAVEAALALARAGTLRSFYGEVRFSTPYAAAQHEGHAEMMRGGQLVEWRVRNYSKPGRQAKYLEQPLLEKAPRYEAVLGAAIRPELR